MGIGVGVAAMGKKGEVVFNHVVDLKVPPAVKNSVKKAVTETKKGAKAAAKTIGKGAAWAEKKAKSELSKAGAELSQFGAVDIDSKIKPEDRSAIVNYLKDEARLRSGKKEMSDAPDAKGHQKLGGSASNSNINAAMKFMGGGAFLPTDGSTGVYLYLDKETNKVSGFAATIKWKFN